MPILKFKKEILIKTPKLTKDKPLMFKTEALMYPVLKNLKDIPHRVNYLRVVLDVKFNKIIHEVHVTVDSKYVGKVKEVFKKLGFTETS